MLVVPVFAWDYPYNKQTTNIASEFIITKECPLPYGYVTIMISTNNVDGVTAVSRVNINSRWGDLSIPDQYLINMPYPRLDRANMMLVEGTSSRHVGTNWIREKIDYGDDVQLSLCIPFTPDSTNETPPYTARYFFICRTNLDRVMQGTVIGRVMYATNLLEPNK